VIWMFSRWSRESVRLVFFRDLFNRLADENHLPRKETRLNRPADLKHPETLHVYNLELAESL